MYISLKKGLKYVPKRRAFGLFVLGTVVVILGKYLAFGYLDPWVGVQVVMILTVPEILHSRLRAQELPILALAELGPQKTTQGSYQNPWIVVSPLDRTLEPECRTLTCTWSLRSLSVPQSWNKQGFTIGIAPSVTLLESAGFGV